MARARQPVFAIVLLYLAAGLIGLVWVALPHLKSAHDGPLTLLCSLAVVTGLVGVLLRRHEPPEWVGHALVAGATAIVSCCVYFNGALYGVGALWYIWATPFAFLSRPRWIVAHMVWLGGAYATALALMHAHDDLHDPFGAYLGYWLVIMSTVVGAGLLARKLTATLRRTHDTMQAGFAGAPSGIAAVGTDGRFMMVNPALCAMLGRDECQLVGSPAADVVDPANRAAMEDAGRRALAGEHVSADLHYRRADGSSGWASMSASLVEGGGFIMVQLLDLTERRAAEEELRASERRFQRLFEDAPIGKVVIDLRHGDEARIAMVNAAICAMLGRPEADLLGTRPGDLLHPEDRTGALARMDDSPADAWATQVRLRRADGSWFWAGVHTSFVRDDDGNPTFLLSQIEDITDSWRRSRQQAAIARVSQSALEHGDLERLFGDAAAAIAETLEVEASAVEVGKDGTVSVRVPGLNEDDATFLSALASVLKSAIRRDEIERELLHRSLHDPLTGLPNRGLLFDRLGRVMTRASRDGAAVSVLFLDLDDFKNVNDSLGHDAGDRLLTEIAARLTAVLRPSDVLARFGGDEFVVLCEGGSGDDHVRVAQRLLGAVAQPVVLGGASFLPRVSVGVATADADATPSSLLRDADVALYRAKGAGKNRVEVFGAEMRAETLERVRLANDLRLAVERGELSVAYQPIVSLRERRVVGVESLVRWTHPVHGVVSPARFIPLAEEDGLIVEIDAFVLARACEEIGPAFPGLGVAVNVSRRQLGRRTLAAETAMVLDVAGMAPSRLTLEVTESALADDPDAARRTLRDIAGMGVGVALDDFGTGQSSLSSLRDYPLRRLKLDRAFVRSLPDGGVDRSIVRAVLDMATTLDLDVVAEGVDSVAKASALWTLGCGYAQGHLFAPAVPLPELDATIARIDAMFASPTLAAA